MTVHMDCSGPIAGGSSTICVTDGVISPPRPRRPGALILTADAQPRLRLRTLHRQRERPRGRLLHTLGRRSRTRRAPGTGTTQRAQPRAPVLLGRVAVDRLAQGSGLGRLLVRDPILSTLAAADRIGVRLLYRASIEVKRAPSLSPAPCSISTSSSTSTSMIPARQAETASTNPPIPSRRLTRNSSSRAVGSR